MEGSKQNKLINKTETDSYIQRTYCWLSERMGGGRLGKKVKGLRGEKSYRHKQYGDCQRERWMGQVEEGKVGTNSDGKRLDLG